MALKAAKKIDGEIYAASIFSEGLAFVELAKDRDKTYCIDKNGNIVFELNIDLSVNGDISSSFINGLAYVNEGLCDTSGKVTKPEDVGATSFIYIPTLKAGYILAEVIKADHSTASMKLGVLNTKFEWTVEPSEDLYKEFTNEYGWFCISSALYTSDYTVGDIYYNTDLNKRLNLKTGEVTNDKLKTEKVDSSLWLRKYGYDHYTGYSLPEGCSDSSQDELIIDLTEKGFVYNATSFVNGRAAVMYYNASVKKYYVTMIDENGEHLFEPVETACNSVETDGEYVLVSDAKLGNADHAQIYNYQGEKMCELDFSKDSGKAHILQISDGVVLVSSGVISMMSGYSGKDYYLDVNGKALF